MYMYMCLGEVMGGVVANVGKSMLPVQLTPEVGINVTALAAHYNSGAAGPVEAVLVLDTGSTKRSTVLKKLLAIGSRGTTGDLPLVLQVDAPVRYSDGSTAAACVFAFAPTVKELQSMISVCSTGAAVSCGYTDPTTGAAASHTLTYDLSTHTVEFPHTAINGCGTATRNSLYLPAPGTGTADGSEGSVFAQGDAAQRRAVREWCAGPDGLVNSFWVASLQAAYEVGSDLLHLLMCAVMLGTPWRLLQMGVALLEPGNRWPWRVGTKCEGKQCCVWCCVC